MVKALHAADAAAPFAQQRTVALAELAETLAATLAAGSTLDDEPISGKD